MAHAVTVNAVATLLSNPQTHGDSLCNIIVQVVQLERSDVTKRYTAHVNDGKQKLKAALCQDLCRDADSGKLEERCLLRITAYVINEVRGSKVLIINKGEVSEPALDMELSANDDMKPIIGLELKPKVTMQMENKAGVGNPIVKSAAQIVQEQRGNAAPAARVGISRRVYPIVSLNPYQGNWTIKVRVTSKGPMRTFKNARGDGNVFNVELTDEDGTQIRATMFKEAADKFFSTLQLNKVYFISKGSLRMANKQYSSIKNDYEMTLNANSEVEEVPDEGPSSQMPAIKHNFVKIDDLGPYVNARGLVEVIGVVQSVGSIVMIRRKSNNEEVPKRDVTIADQSQKTVVVSLWNAMAMEEGATLADIVNEAPIMLVKSLRVSDFQGLSLSTTMNSMVAINPDIPDATALRTWYEQDGKSATLASAGASLPGGLSQAASRSSFADRAVLSEVTQPSVGEGKPAYFNVRAYISYIKPDQAMWYLACTACTRKVVEESSTSYWCEGCQNHFDSCNRRYIMLAKMSDSSGETFVSAFNEQAEMLLGQSAESLATIRDQGGDGKPYEAVLRKAMWVPHVYRISVAQTEYMNEKRQRVTVRSVGPVDWSAESRLLLESIANLK